MANTCTRARDMPLDHKIRITRINVPSKVEYTRARVRKSFAEVYTFITTRARVKSEQFSKEIALKKNEETMRRVLVLYSRELTHRFAARARSPELTFTSVYALTEGKSRAVGVARRVEGQQSDRSLLLGRRTVGQFCRACSFANSPIRTHHFRVTLSTPNYTLV